MDSRTLRRVTAGLLIGGAVALLEVFFVSLSDRVMSGSVTIGSLGGIARLLIAGLILGVSYALLHSPLRRSLADGTMNGIVLGVVVWVVLALNVYPLLQARAPMWSVRMAADIFPKLIAYVLQGSLIGFIYHLVADKLIETPMEFVTTRPAVEIHVVVVGGGYAGVSAAEALEQEFEDDHGVTIWLVSSTNYLVHTPMLSEVSASAVSPQNISPPLRNFFRRVRVVQGEVDRVDWDSHHVILSPKARSPHRALPFTHLLVTTGGVPNFFGNETVAANMMTFKSLPDSMRLRNRIIDMFERAEFEQDSDKKRRMLTFVVVGGGFAGVELIGGLNDFGRGMLPYYPSLMPEDLRFVLIHTRKVILPELNESLGQFAQERMSARGVEFLLNRRVTGARPGAVIMGDKEIAAETMVWTAGNRPGPLVEKLGVELTPRGQIPVTSELRSSQNGFLWAAGDCAQIPQPSNPDHSYPPTAQHATREGKLMGHNVAAAIRGQPLRPFEFKTLGSLAALGHQLAVAEIFGYRFSGFLAWVLWRGIYLAKLPNMERRLRVLLDWVLDIFFPPDIVQTIHFEAPASPERET